MTKLLFGPIVCLALGAMTAVLLLAPAGKAAMATPWASAPPDDPAAAANIRAMRIGICLALAAIRSGAGTSDGAPAPDLRITPGREAEIMQILDVCGVAVVGTPDQPR